MRLTGTVECGVWDELTTMAMGSPAVIIAGDAPREALDWAQSTLQVLEHCWSRFLPDSELSALNRSAGQWFTMSHALANAVDRALRLPGMTGGLFDPTIHQRLEALGYDRPFRILERSQRGTVPPPSQAPGVGGIERDGASIRLPLGTSLDLGGVGKGLAADIIATGLVEMGATSACVSLGGDIRVTGGVPEDGGWSIPIGDPNDSSRQLGFVLTAHAAIVTSTTAFRSWTRNGRPMHHLIDPRNGMPAEVGVRAVVVTAPEAWLAEAFAKAALIAGPVAGRRLLDQAGLGGWLIGVDGSCTATEWAPQMTNASRRSNGRDAWLP